MAEMSSTADDLVVIAGGSVVAQGSIDEVVGDHAGLEDAFFTLTAGGKA
jgi:ABC-2 type transport system ATP-binding protein